MSAAIPGPVTAALLASPWMGAAPALEIDPRDEMYREALERRGGEADSARAEYLAAGAALARAVGGVVADFFAPERPASLLDFAAGFGRVTRWLARDGAARRLAVAELQSGAAEFVARWTDAAAIPTGAAPEAFAPRERFAAIVAVSLFTHLPADLFAAWLARLAAALADPGVLLVSTFDAAFSPEGRIDDPSGVRFAARSESRALDAAIYGTTWVREEVVRDLVARLPGGFVARRLALAFPGRQDLWLVARRTDRTRLERVAPPALPRGAIEEAAVDAQGVLALAGWATAGEAVPRRVALRVGAREVASTEVFAPRTDLGRGSVAAGFRLEARLPAADSRAALPAILSVAGGGGENALFAGTVAELLRAAAELRAAAALARAERAEANLRLARASAFGRAYRVWLRAKRAAGLLPADFPADLLDPDR